MASSRPLSEFRTRPHSLSTADAFQSRLRARRKWNNLSRSQEALKLQISKGMLQEWEQNRAGLRGLARTAIEKTIRAWRAHVSLSAGVAIRESRIASR
jgi:DNA-binding transcriptional regulator YiaG